MMRNTKQRVWNEIGVAAIEYGFTVFLVAATVYLVYFSDISFMTRAVPVIGVQSVGDLLLLGVPAFLVFFLRFGDGNRETPVWMEAGLAVMAVAGLWLPLATAGFFLFLATSDYAYTGIEKWLPEIEDRERRELARFQRAVSALELPEPVQTRAMELLEEARDKQLMRNRPFDEMLGAIIYIATREAGSPRTLEEIAEVTGASKKRIGNAYRYIGRNTDVRVLPPQPEDYLPRFADRLQLGDTVRDQAETIIEAASEKSMLSGKSPKGTAAAALYLAAGIEGDERTMKEVSNLLDVTTITIRERTLEFLEELDLDNVPDHFYQLGES